VIKLINYSIIYDELGSDYIKWQRYEHCTMRTIQINGEFERCYGQAVLKKVKMPITEPHSLIAKLQKTDEQSAL
jgi:hypothetical protein